MRAFLFFLTKAHVSGHYRTINGVKKWIDPYTDKRPSAKPKIKPKGRDRETEDMFDPRHSGDLFGHEPGTKPDKTAGKLEPFIRKHGGAGRLLSILRGLSDDQRGKVLAEMGKLAKRSPEQVYRDLQDRAGAEGKQAGQGDLFHIPETDSGNKPAETDANPSVEKVPETKPASPKPDDKPIDPKRLAALNVLIHKFGGKIKVAAMLRHDRERAEKVLGELATAMGVSMAAIKDAVGLSDKPANTPFNKEPEGGWTEADKIPGSDERLAKIKARRDEVKGKTYAEGDMIEGDEIHRLPPGTELRIVNEQYPSESRRILVGRGSLWFGKTRGEGWQKNPAAPQHRNGLINGGYGKFRIEKMGREDWLSDAQRNTVESMRRNKPNAKLFMLGEGSGMLVMGEPGNPKSFRWIGEDIDTNMSRGKDSPVFSTWGAGFTPKQQARIEAGDMTPVPLNGEAPEQSTGGARDYRAEAMALARRIMGKRKEATTKDINRYLEEARREGIPHEALFFGDDPAYQKHGVTLVAAENAATIPEKELTPVQRAEKVKKLRREADALTQRAHRVVDGIPMGQKVVSVADRNRREKAAEYMRRAVRLEEEANQLEAAGKRTTTQAAPQPSSPEKPVYRYALPMRPPAPGAVPKGFISHEQAPDIPEARHGVITYDRPLTPDEIKNHELVPISGQDGNPLELPKVPAAVATKVRNAMESLHYMANEVRTGNVPLSDYAEDIAEAHRTLKIFDDYANRRGIDKDKVLAELGGIPDFAEPKEGDTKTEDGITYELRGGRWHRVTPEENHINLSVETRVKVTEETKEMVTDASKKILSLLGVNGVSVKFRIVSGRSIAGNEGRGGRGYDGSYEIEIPGKFFMDLKRSAKSLPRGVNHKDLLQIMIHELTHVSQYALGKLDGDKWKGRDVDPHTGKKYRSLSWVSRPWEQEAVNNETKLIDDVWDYLIGNAHIPSEWATKPIKQQVEKNPGVAAKEIEADGLPILTPEEKNGTEQSSTFQPTHELPNGTPVVAHPDEPNVWLDAQGGEWEDEDATPLAMPAQDKKEDHPTTKPQIGDFVAYTTKQGLRVVGKVEGTNKESGKAIVKVQSVDGELDTFGDVIEVTQDRLEITEPAETKPAEPYVPFDGWETNLFKLRHYAAHLGIPHTGKDQETLLARIREKIGYVPPASFGVAPGVSKAERKRLNQEARDILNREANSRLGKTYSEADKAILRQYSGNGGVGDSLNEYYTLPDVAAAMWSVLQRMGLPSDAKVLEPSSGPGVFLHTAPPGVRCTGVELDTTSAEIAGILHGDRHEVRNASLERFATQDTRQFDAVIGNAPFGLRGSLLKDDKKDLSTAEQYFLDTALDKTKPGGIVAMIVPTGILDNQGTKAFRERMLKKGEFLGAVRMPNTAFEHAHTGVTTDIVFLRKRPDDVAGALMTVKPKTMQALGLYDEDVINGGYFNGRGAPNVFGTMEAGWRAKAGIGQDITVTGSMQGIPEAIAQFQPDHREAAAPTVPGILDALGDDEKAKERALGGALRKPYERAAKVGDTKLVDGVTYVLQGKPPRWHRIDEYLQTPDVTEAQAIAADIDRLFSGQAVNRPDLETRLKAYVETHGNPNKNPNIKVAAGLDRTLYRILGAVNPDGSLSDAVRGQAPRQIEGSFESIVQALSADTHGARVGEIAEAAHLDEDEAEHQLYGSAKYALDPASGNWTTLDQYLTGDLWGKLDAVNAQLAHEDLDPATRRKYEIQAKRLDETIAPKGLEDVDIALNSGFIPTEILSRFFTERNQSGNEWQRKLDPVQITFKEGVYEITGGNQYGELKNVSKYLNRTGLRQDDLPTIEALNEEFKQWLCASEHREQVEDLYNRKFRGFVPEAFSNAPIDIPGMSTQGLKDYQWSGLRWALATGKGIIAADVGLGKTARALMLARMLKVTGKAQRPVITVPKSVLANWFAEAEKWFPGSRVLTIGGTFERQPDGTLKGKDDTADERKRKYHSLTQNDYDFIIISEPAFEELDLDPITKHEYNERDFWVRRGTRLGNEGDKRTKKIREGWNQARAKQSFADKERTDAIYFNELGIDGLIVDEAHHQKNLYAARARFGDSPKFLGGQGLSMRALDFNLKARWLLDQTNNRNVYGLSATVTKNSPLEVYSMLSHVAPEAFDELGIRNSEDFLDRFCEFQRDKILTTDGDIEDALVTAGFKNLGELREIMSRYIDRKTAADVGLVLPERDDRMHLVDMDAQQEAEYERLRAEAERSASDQDNGTHIFSLMDQMNKAALDLELLDPDKYKGHVSPKYKALAEEVKRGAAEGGQVIFSDYIGAHDKIVEALVKAGIPKHQIGVINAQVASSATKRQNIAEAFNSSKLRVVVGNTATMGEGINLQKGTTDIHHLDLPWEPASMQQRNGRGLRQGNINEAVRIHSYLSKGSFDGYRYQSIAAKKDWQDLLWNGGDRIDNLARAGRVSRDEMLIMLAADPEAARAKFESDKAAANEREAAEGRRQTASEFVRFQEMTANFHALPNKDTRTAARLKSRIDEMRNRLSRSRYFRHKNVLDLKVPVLVHPDTGEAFYEGVGFTDDKGGQWVCTGVSRGGAIAARKYADPAGTKVQFNFKDDGPNLRAFKFDQDEEAAEIHKKLEASALGDGQSINSLLALRDIPDDILTKNHDKIQTALKEADKSYKLKEYNDRLPMIHRETGKVVAPESYERNKLLETHDFLLPTSENIGKIKEAWKRSERNRKYGTHTFQKRKNSRYETRAEVHYPDAGYGKTYNPYTAILQDLTVGPSKYDKGTSNHQEREAVITKLKKEFAEEQVRRVRRAPTFEAALHEAMSTGTLEGQYGDEDKAKVNYPEKVLAMLWARAKLQGVLGRSFSDFEPKDPDSRYGRHSSYAFHNRYTTTGTVNDVLYGMAQGSGHRALANAIAEAGEKHYPEQSARAKLEMLSQGHGHSVAELRTMLKVAERAGIADQKLSEAKFTGGVMGPNRSSYWNYSSGPTWEDRTVRRQLENAIEATEKREVAIRDKAQELK
jgi:SNF2 family DNA or RNA helicase/predicted RNA methylase